MTYDDAGWHQDTALNLGLEPEAAATHIGIYFAWARSRGLVNDSERGLDLLDARMITPRAYLYRFGVPELNEYLFTAEGNAFTAVAYRDYLHAYGTVPLIAGLPTIYHAGDGWEFYDAVAPMLDDALNWWRGADRPRRVP